MMKTYEILNLLKNLEIVVPEFQREYVWSKKQAKQLMDSLFHKYPVGSLLIWETGEPPKIKNDAIDQKKLRIWKVLLDGQQRLTTLYLLIKNEIPPYYKKHEITHDPRDLYFNLETRNFSYHVKSIMAGDPCWQKVVDCLDQELNISRFLEKIVKDTEKKPNLHKTIGDNLDELRAILRIKHPIQTVPKTAKIDIAIDVFDRVNSEGKKLNEAELVLAHITEKWPEARQKMKEKIRELESERFFSPSDYQKNLDFFTRCIIVSITESALYKKNTKLKDEQLSPKNCSLHWQKVIRSMDYLLPLLKQDVYVSSTNDLSTTNLLVPIIAYLLKNDCKFAKGKRSGFFYWMLLALIWGRYSGQTDQRLNEDVRWAMNGSNQIESLVDEIKKQRGEIRVTSTDLKERGSRHPIYKMLYIITKRKKAIDWDNGGAIYDTIGKYHSIQSHHIFPRAFLCREKFDLKNRLDKKKVNEIANRVFITSTTNFKLSDTKPSIYLPEVKEKYPGALEQQFIPVDRSLWNIEKYDNFLAKRREMIADEINIFIEELHEKSQKTEE